MGSVHYLEDRNLSMAWARALQLATTRGRSELTPLVLAVTGFGETGDVEEKPEIRAALEALLAKETKQSVDTVANTIFPASLWNPAASRQLLFERYDRIVARIRAASRKNSRGTI